MDSRRGIGNGRPRQTSQRPAQSLRARLASQVNSTPSNSARKITTPSAMKPKSQQVEYYTISGIKVEFPHKAYPSQVSVMEKVLQCLIKSKNGLLESPTGSGKSLALLCSSLAWQKTHIMKGNEAIMVAAQQPLRSSVMKTESDAVRRRKNIDMGSSCSSLDGLSSLAVSKGSPMHCCSESSNGTPLSCGSPATSSCSSNAFSSNNRTLGPSLGQSPFQQSHIKASNSSIYSRKSEGNSAVNYEMESDDDESMPSIPFPGPLKSPSFEESDYKSMVDTTMDYDIPDDFDKVPVIYFCTRTHKQVAQLVRELRKTTYTNIRMTVLGSREQYCIHDVVSRLGNKNELCKELLDKTSRNRLEDEVDLGQGQGCSYFRGARNINHVELFSKHRLPAVFDIEDLLDTGKRNGFCPYFTSRELSKHSQLIFCPYNYLVDPKIRRTMEIDIEGQVVIFDEGHNLEDAAREAASLSVTAHSLAEAVQDMVRVVTLGGQTENPAPVKEIVEIVLKKCQALATWIETAGRNIDAGLQAGSKNHTGPEMIYILSQFGLGPDGFENFKNSVALINADQDYKEDEVKETHTVKITAHTLMLLNGLCVVMDYMYRNQQSHAPDYRVVLVKEMTKDMSYLELSNGFRRKRKTQETSQWTYTLHFWCLNPAVAFEDFKTARAVVLTSGTLSPMISFQSELGLDFGIQFEANHVIDMKQVWAGAIGWGPKNSLLMGNYQTVNTLMYQDDVGEAILRICSIVPKGVLCFFTSYGILNNMFTRWQENGMLEKLERRKFIISEPKNAGDRSVFDKKMEDFGDAIKGDNLAPGQDGAIMFAVCRGKVSEGLDFSDDNARAVITVGIPYPNFKDPQVTMKRLFNDGNKGKGLLPGSEWYDIQAFRAINQALGRCLRHKNDWGALILIDSRFATAAPNSKYISSLSKWLRPQVKRFHAGHFNGAMQSLEQFIRTNNVHALLHTLPPINQTVSTIPKKDMDSNTEKDFISEDEEFGIVSRKLGSRFA